MNHHRWKTTFQGRCIVAISTLLAGCCICQWAGAVEPTPFANYFRLAPTGPTTLDALFEPGPFPEALGGYLPPGGPLPGWDENVESSFLVGGDPPTVDPATLIATIPLNDTLTSIARDADGNELGRLVTLGVGSNRVDLNADHAVVDDDAGTIQVQLGSSLLGGNPSATLSVIEATGIYASDVVLVGDVFGSGGGHFLLPLDDDPATTLQENILNAFAGGQIIGSDTVGVWAGQYVPEPSASFMLASSALLLLLVWSWRGPRLAGRNR